MLLDLVKLRLGVLLEVRVGRVVDERLLLRGVPVLVEPALGRIGQVLRPDGGQCAQALRGLDVSDHTDGNHRRSLDDGDGLDHLLLVDLGARLVDLTQDVGHARLVPEESRQVDLLRGVIRREGLHLTPVALGPLAREETQRTVAGALELTVRHRNSDVCVCWQRQRRGGPRRDPEQRRKFPV